MILKCQEWFKKPNISEWCAIKLTNHMDLEEQSVLTNQVSLTGSLKMEAYMATWEWLDNQVNTGKLNIRMVKGFKIYEAY